MPKRWRTDDGMPGFDRRTAGTYCPATRSPPVMPTPTTEGFINKREAAEIYKRSHRSLSRDITTAVRTRDLDTLQHFRLQTQDGEVREGTEVTIELLDQLRDDGQVPTWWGARDYLHQRYGLRGEAVETPEDTAQPKSDESPQPQPPHHENTVPPVDGSGKPQLPSDPIMRAIVLEHLHYNDQQHARQTEAMMDRILQVVETNQQLQAQTNTLMNQFQETLKEGGGLRKLIAGNQSSQPDRQPNQVTDASVVDSGSGDAAHPKSSSKQTTTSKAPKKQSKISKKKTSPSKSTSPKSASIWNRDVRDLLSFRSSRKPSS